ncbi:DUF2332 domain-containing protein [Paracoccus pacificus]|uniref:DUF2332 domain-containing protein n=1 Tax=Paracoccus pacificus TaxID=1463598 RepID=A0ABW4R5Q6_9RHOB
MNARAHNARASKPRAPNAWAPAFEMQANACRALGSELTARICDAMCRVIAADDGPVARSVRDWPGDPTYRGDSVPLRLCGALQGLVLTDRVAALSADPAVSLDDRIAGILHAHEGWFLDWLDRPPQTNEVGRSAVLIAGARFLAGLSSARFDLYELGGSAGLNLNFPRYLLDPDDEDADSSDIVILRPTWRSGRPKARALPTGAARGVDLNPLDPNRDGLRLMSYIWPDQPERLERMRAALRVAARHPPQVDRDEAAPWLEAQLAPPPVHGRLVYHTVAAQYFPPETRARVEAALQSAGARATANHPLAHLSMESDTGNDMALDLRLWDDRGVRTWRLGRSQAHGRWIDWQPKEIG